MLVGIVLAMGLYLAIAAGVPSGEVLALAVPVAALGVVAGVVSWLQMVI